MTLPLTDDELAAQISGKICLRCETEPRVIWMGSFGENRHGLRCNCESQEDFLNPMLGKDVHPIKRRYGEMVDQSLATQPDKMPLTLEEVQQYLSPHANEAEGHLFLRFCQAMDLNPFINEVYLIKYDTRAKAAIVIGIAALLKRASRNSHYQGYQAGIVVTDADGAKLEVEGSLLEEDQTLIGGWAEIARGDWQRPLKVVVSLREYDRGQSVWKQKPGTMIEKTAISQGLRRAFPDEIGSLYEQQQVLAVEVADGEDLEGTGKVSIPDKAQVQQDGEDLFGPGGDASASKRSPARPAPQDEGPEPDALDGLGSGDVPEYPVPPEVVSQADFKTYCTNVGWSPSAIVTALGVSAYEWIQLQGDRTYRTAILEIQNNLQVGLFTS